MNNSQRHVTECFRRCRSAEASTRYMYGSAGAAQQGTSKSAIRDVAIMPKPISQRGVRGGASGGSNTAWLRII